jgi:hypothetical protein
VGAGSAPDQARAEATCRRKIPPATWCRAAADRSIRHPAQVPPARAAIVYNLFALAFAQVGDARSAAAQFELIGDCVTQRPWEYLGSPAERCVAVRSGARAG